MRRIQSGELKYRIQIVKPPIDTGETDDNGLPIINKPVTIDKYAKVTNSSYKKNEMLIAQGLVSFNSLDFTFRYCEIDKVKDYIIYEGKKYDIKTAIDLYNDKTFILATGVVIDG